jgi:AcrR family transcriptional regulator
MNAENHKPRGRPRDAEHTAQRRDEILIAATRLFARHGFPGADVQLLADELGIGKGTIYRYFPSKRELFLAAVDSGMRRLTDRIDNAVAACAEPLERMRTGVRNYLAFFVENPDLVELFIQERAEFRDRETPTYFIWRERNFKRWMVEMAALMDTGRIRRLPVERITQVIGDLLYGTMFTNYFARRRVPVEQQAADIIDLTFRGILTDEERKALYDD